MSKQDLILLALDASPALELMARTLRASEFEVSTVQDREGLEKLVDQSVPALVLVGENFGGEDGLLVSQALLERFPTLPIILYAAGVVSAETALRAGLSGILRPPLKGEDVVGEVRRSMSHAQKLGDWVRREVKRTTASLEQKAKISEAERNKLEAIISNIQDGVIVLDDHQQILLVNQTVYDIFDLEKESLVGKKIREVIANADLSALIDRARNGTLKYHEINFDDGRVFNAQYTPLPRIGSAVTMQDISYLKEIDRLKNDFVHTVSHDLRSPLTAILGYMELIERTGPLNESQLEFIERLRASVQHMTGLVNELLDLGRLEAGFDTRREMVYLDTILQYSLAVFDNQVRRKNIQLTSDVAGDLKPLRANPIRIRQMIDNLIGNAVKYTPPNGMVKISMAMQENQLILRVTDSGPGIPTEEQNRIFEKFFRASNRPAGVEGTGLGLAIVKSIVEAHQGRVWVESKVGTGSTFVVILPVHQ
ncbi:MAG: PAS-domain containing protein [Chloroflexi bacterium]|nr:PAS-domain containing protein [Chloroflexota bacterium]